MNSGASRVSPDADPVGVLREALGTSVHVLARLTEDAPGAVFAAQRALTAVMDAVLPVQEALLAVAVAHPVGEVAQALGFIRNAVAHVDAGDIASARAAVLTAHTTLARLIPPENPDTLPAPDWRF